MAGYCGVRLGHAANNRNGRGAGFALVGGGAPIPDQGRESEQDGPITGLEALLVWCAYLSLTKADALEVLAEAVIAAAAWYEVVLGPAAGLPSRTRSFRSGVRA